MCVCVVCLILNTCHFGMYAIVIQEHFSTYLHKSLKSNKNPLQTCSDNEYTIIVTNNKKGNHTTQVSTVNSKI